MRKRTQARECALQILYQLDVTKQSMEDALADFWQQNPFPAEVREFSEILVKGTHEHLADIDRTIEEFAENWQLHRMAVIDRNILRAATFELLYLDEVPPKVTINEAVNIAKKFSQDEAGKFVNGILDKIHHTKTPSTKIQGKPDSKDA